MNTAVSFNISDNDNQGTNNLDISTIAFIPGTEPDPATIGIFTNNTDGTVTFTPASGFTGIATIDYQICDIIGLCDVATITVTVNTVDGPTAVDDQATTLINTPVEIEILDNDTPGAAAIDPTSVSLVNGTEPDPAAEGVFTVDPITGNVTFTPVNGFLGTVTVDYQVCDLNALCDIATITVNVMVGASNLYPALGPGTLAFEDLWPGKGDYDFNDMVIDYQFEIISNPSNYVEQVVGTFVLKAFGASFENGFGFQLSDAIDPSDVTVTGYQLTDNIVTLDGNGTEAGQSKPTIIVFDNAFAHMPHPGIGIGVNTTPDAPYVQPVTFTISMQFTPNTVSFNDLDIANFNPFIIVNKVRNHEVHLPYYPPTDLADTSLFGQWEDASDPATGKYYVTATNLPWAINIYESFDYPIEKQDILQVHLKFAEWATSGGIQFPDWYKNLSGYRNQSLIYQIPEE
jgi:LruC domain-containing protein